MNNYRKIGLVAMLLAVASFAGCTAESGGTVKIVSISPEPYTTVRVGDKVELKMDVDYTLKKTSADITLVVQKEDNSSLGSVKEAVKEGSGRVTLKHAFQVPETRIVTAYVSMSYGGYKATRIVESRTYNIAPKK